jgi:hypothetical protein
MRSAVALAFIAGTLAWRRDRLRQCRSLSAITPP